MLPVPTRDPRCAFWIERRPGTAQQFRIDKQERNAYAERLNGTAAIK